MNRKQELKRCLFEYEHEGKVYGFTIKIKADNLEDIIKHLQSVRDTVVFIGQSAPIPH